MIFSKASLLAVLGVATAIQYASAFNTRNRDALIPRQTSTTANDYSTEYWFDQLIDHANPSAGTFKQRYFFSDQYYKGQGAPIVIGTPGEQSADGFYSDLTGASMMNWMMQSWGAAGVVLEHRYWGKSSPYTTLTAPNLQWLTVQQAIDDYKYFVETVVLPWATGAYTTTPTSTPWVNIGCSYPGLLVAYTQEQYPDLFAAGYATSAPVNADGDFWEYWEPIEEGMPQNCSADLAAAINYMDNIMANGTPEEVTAMKAKFGMESLANDDFGTSLQWPINTWQDMQAYDYAQQGTTQFYQFCDAIETNADGTYNQNAQGVGMPLAFENWAKTYKALGPDKDCPGTGASCYSTADPNSQMYTDTSVSDVHARAWVWLLCTQLGWFQVGDMGNSSTIISNQVTPAFFQRQCSYYFPLADGTHSTYDFSKPVNDINTQFKSWNVVGNNLYVVNGEFDPWRSASLSSKWAPSFTDTPTQTITVVPNGHHCWDFYLANGEVDPNVKSIQEQGISEIRGWLENWYAAHPGVTNTLSAAGNNVATANVDAVVDDDDDDDEPDGLDNNPSSADPNAVDDEDDEDDEGDQPDGTDPTADAAAVDDEDDEDDEGDQPDGSDPNANAEVVDDEDDEGDQPDGTDPTADGTDPTADGTDPNASTDDVDDVDDEEDGPSSNPNTAGVEVVDDDDDDTLNSIATDAGADDAATGEIQTNGNDNNSNNNNSELQNKIDQLAANKKLAVASFIVNGVLALLVIGCLVLLFLTKRKANKSRSTAALPRWVGGKEGVHEGDQLGEYGTGRRAGGRGQYKTLEEQTH